MSHFNQNPNNLTLTPPEGTTNAIEEDNHIEEVSTNEEESEGRDVSDIEYNSEGADYSEPEETNNAKPDRITLNNLHPDQYLNRINPRSNNFENNDINSDNNSNSSESDEEEHEDDNNNTSNEYESDTETTFQVDLTSFV